MYVPKFQDFQKAAPGQKYTLNPTRPTSIPMLQTAINNAVTANGGPFNRIILLSHAGGLVNAPAALLSKPDPRAPQPMAAPRPSGGVPLGNRMNYNARAMTRQLQRANFPLSLSNAIGEGLAPGGIFVLQSCGHYNELSEPGQKLWNDNLKAMAKAIGHGAYASQGNLEPNLSLGGTPYPYAENAPYPNTYKGFGPDGNQLP